MLISGARNIPTVFKLGGKDEEKPINSAIFGISAEDEEFLPYARYAKLGKEF
jgi:hypothetical protein